MRSERTKCIPVKLHLHVEFSMLSILELHVEKLSSSCVYGYVPFALLVRLYVHFYAHNHMCVSFFRLDSLIFPTQICSKYRLFVDIEFLTAESCENAVPLPDPSSLYGTRARRYVIVTHKLLRCTLKSVRESRDG